jgi:WD40 repeat protein
MFITLSSVAAQDNECTGLLPARLVPGGQGRVLPPTPNNLRAQPDADSHVIFEIPADGIFEILDDAPVCAGGYRWWHVRFTAFEGWTAEGDRDEYWLIPAPTNGREVITGDNVTRLELVETLGFGLISNVQWDGDDLILRTSTGDWRYSTTQPERMPEPTVIEALPRLETYIEGDHVQVVEGETVRITLRHPAHVVGVWFSPDYHYLVTRTDFPTTLRLWDTQTGGMMGVLPGLDFFTSDGRYVGYMTEDIADSNDDILHLIELVTLNEVATFIYPRGERNALGVGDSEVSPDNRFLVTVEGCQMCILQLIATWDMATGERLATLVDDAGDIWSFAFNTSGTRLAGASTQGEVVIWDTVTWNAQTLMPGNHDINHVEFNSDGRILCYSDFYERSFRWDRVGRQMPVLSDQPCVLHPEITTSADGCYIVALDNEMLEVRENDTLLWSMDNARGSYRKVTFSPDGRLLVATGEETSIFDTATGVNIASFPEQDWSSVAVFSPAGRILVIGPHFDGWTFSSYPYNIVWDTGSREIITTLSPIPTDAEPPHVYGIYDAAFSPSGDVLVTTSIGVAHIWDTRTWTLIGQIDDYQNAWGGEDVLTAAFSPDGTLLALGGGSAFESYSSESVVRVYGVGQR